MESHIHRDGLRFALSTLPGPEVAWSLARLTLVRGLVLPAELLEDLVDAERFEEVAELGEGCDSGEQLREEFALTHSAEFDDVRSKTTRRNQVRVAGSSSLPRTSLAHDERVPTRRYTNR